MHWVSDVIGTHDRYSFVVMCPLPQQEVTGCEAAWYVASMDRAVALFVYIVSTTVLSDILVG